MRRPRARRRIDWPWRPQPGIAHVWCVAGPVCEDVVPRDVGITDGLLAWAEQYHHDETCALCLTLVYVFFGSEAFQNALRTRRGFTPEYDDDYDDD